MKQISLFQQQAKPFHGGELSKGRRKSKRPLARKRPIHLILKAKTFLLPERNFIQRETRNLAKHFSIRIYEFAIALDHAHLVIQIPGRREYAAFIRSLAGRIAKRIGKGLWQSIPFTRVASWGKDFRNLLAYVKKNREETEGRRTYQPRKDYYKKYRPRP